MPEDSGRKEDSKESKKPNPTTQEANAGEDTNTEANNIANEILQQFKLKQAQTNNNENEGSATASVGFLTHFCEGVRTQMRQLVS